MQLARFFIYIYIYLDLYGRRFQINATNFAMLDQRSRGNGGGACAQSGNLPHTPSPFIFHSVFLTVTHGFRASYIQPTWKAWMGPPLQQSVTQPVIARYVRLSASPCRLSRAHASGERVHAAGGQRVHAGCRSCVGKRCIVSALTRCVANINQDNRRILRLYIIAPARQKCIAFTY